MELLGMADLAAVLRRAKDPPMAFGIVLGKRYRPGVPKGFVQMDLPNNAQ